MRLGPEAAAAQRQIRHLQVPLPEEQTRQEAHLHVHSGAPLDTRPSFTTSVSLASVKKANKQKILKFGQFLDHDITLTPENDKLKCCDKDRGNKECFPIDVIHNSMPHTYTGVPDGSFKLRNVTNSSLNM